LNAEQAVKRLFFTMSNRYLYRKSRAENLLAKWYDFNFII